MMSVVPNQLWLGNIPAGMNEDSVMGELRAYDIRPYKVVIRSSPHHTVVLDLVYGWAC